MKKKSFEKMVLALLLTGTLFFMGCNRETGKDDSGMADEEEGKNGVAENEQQSSWGTGNDKQEFVLSGRWFEKEIQGQKAWVTLNDGAMIYFKTEGTDNLNVHFLEITALETPYYAYIVDDGEPVRQLITESHIALPDDKEHRITIVVDGMTEFEDKWNGEIGVAFTGVDSPGGKITGFTPEKKRILFVGDSITDGRYYLYYVLDHVCVVSVAVCDTPAGEFEFYGYVHYQDGTRLGERAGDQPQFDPGVLTEGNKTYLYTGFCSRGDKSRSGAMVTVLGTDMLTIEEEPQFIVPGCEYSKGSGFEGHEYFEAASIRKVGSDYYFIYSSIVMHELCYAVSKEPTRGFVYGGVIVSNCDMHIDTYKPADKPMAYGANNHGSIVQIGESWYIFYHRHTNGTWYSRQGCAEKIEIAADGSIAQVEMTSCGLNGGPLCGEGEYGAYLACNLFTETESVYVGDDRFPKIMQDGRDGDEEPGYIGNIKEHATAGFKYFECKGVREIAVKTRGYANGYFEVRTKWDGEALAEIPIESSNVWEEYSASVNIPDGQQAIYLTYRGEGNPSLLSFTLRAAE